MMSHKQVLQSVIAVILVMSFLVGCGGSAPTAVSEAPVATSTPEQATPTPTPERPTPTPVPSTITLQKVYLVYDYCDTRGFMVGCEDTTITVNKLPVVADGGAKVEIPFADIANITMQPSKRQHPEVAHWDIEFLDATVTLKNQKTIHCEIGSYLPLPASGSKPAEDLYNTVQIEDVYLSGEMADTGLMTKMSLFDVKAISIDAPGDPPESLGTVIISPRENETME